MIYGIFQGPKEQWRAEAERCNKHALLGIIDHLVEHIAFMGVRLDRQSLRTLVADEKKWGKVLNASNDLRKMKENPEKFFRTLDRRRRAAKRSARERKLEKRRN
ncbi:MAG: hypothetical protein P4K83_02255 [Terracidiphilus sp.]|nr:hypothetical protein [Terracidiphilus sp.]